LDRRGRLWLRAFNDIGARAVEQLRLVCIELQMAPTRTAVHLGMEPYSGVTKKGKDLSGYDHLHESADATLDELAWRVHASKAGREEAVGSVGAKR
jgi:NAD(P)H-dependent FMN reductase